MILDFRSRTVTRDHSIRSGEPTIRGVRVAAILDRLAAGEPISAVERDYEFLDGTLAKLLRSLAIAFEKAAP